MLSKRGFTIVEVIVALLVLSIGLLGAVSVFASSARNSQSGHNSAEVSASATEVLEIARASGCSASRAGAANALEGVYSWKSEEITSQLQLVTVVFNPSTPRHRADTFSAILAC
jgi:type IV pilus modification protein PilV